MPTIYNGSATPTDVIALNPIGTIALAGAEISAFDAASKRLFVTSSSGLQIVDVTDPSAPTLISTLAIASLYIDGGDVTSVASKNGIVAVAVSNVTKTSPGRVVFIEAATGEVLNSVAVGSLPDMVTFTPDGTKVLVANEGEPLTDEENGTIDPAGRISVIDIAGGVTAATVTNVTFTAFNAQQAELEAAGVRIDEGKLLSQGLEPEYIAVSPDGTQAFITLQENNAFAILDLATNTITSIVPLGTKDYGLADNAADFSDRDTPGSSNAGIINIQPAPGVVGLYQPDAIASFTANGQTYYVTANEGDSYEDFGDDAREDEIRVGAATLDPALVASIVNASPTDVYVDEASIKNNDNLGRLTVSTFGDTDGDGDLDQLQSYGGRSFSIWDANGTLVFDSGSLIERATSALTPDLFNANNGVASAFDTRSDDKAAEPEGITVGTIGGRTYAFVALERAGGGVMSFDITDPANVTFANYARNEGDISAEGVLFIDGQISPNGNALVAVSNEVSSTLTIYEVVENTFTLQLLHLADGEAGLLASDTAPLLAALVDAFDDDYENTLILAGGDNFLPGPFLAAGTDASVAATHNKGNNPGAADIEIHNRIGVEASTIGNHEFDLGTNAFSDVINDAAFPYLSSNLDFSADSGISGRFSANGVDGDPTTAIGNVSSLARTIVPAAVVEKGGEQIGLVGVTTQILEAISSTGNVEVEGFAEGSEVNDMALLAAQLQPVIDELIAQGVNKIILMAHLQQIAFEQELATLLTGVDIILAAGSNTRLGDADDVAVAFPGHAADFADTYPIVTAGADGKTTVIVNTDNEYTYLGRLVVEFDSNGEIILESLDELVAVNGAYASTVENVAAAWGDTDGDLSDTAFAEGTKGEQVADITEAVDAVIQAKDGDVAGFTNVYLEGERNLVRNQETNLGNITADANLNALTDALGTAAETTFVASLKNGGGIRAPIGAVDVATGAKEPPLANPDAGKPENAVSLLDIENSLRFNNGLMAFDTTAAGLKAILEHGVAVLGGQGRYPQIGGVSFSYDDDLPAGSRVQSIALIDEDDKVVAVIVENGVVSPTAPATITMVTLNFLANGGDGYPIKANGENFRFLLNDGTLSAPVDEALNFTASTVVPANILGEQQAMVEYLEARYATPETAFNEADTDQTGDTRIQNLDFREDTVLTSVITGTEAGETIEGTFVADTINALGGDDVVLSSDGNDAVDGGEGNDTADYSAETAGVNVNLAAGEAKIIAPTPVGFLTKEAAQLDGENGFTVTPLITVGDIITGTTGALNSTSAGTYQPVGILDGIGAFSLDADTVRVFVNHELANNRGQAYTLENGLSLQGARISYFDIDKTTKSITDAGIAYNEVYDPNGNPISNVSSFVNNALGFDRFCSGMLVEAEQFGAGRGISERIYFAGEETGGNFSPTAGAMWALDVDTGELWAVPAMGRGAWENATEVDTGTTTHVAFILSDDSSPFNAGGDASNEAAPLWLYVGEKNPAGNFLEKNGLDGGKLYAWVPGDATKNSPLTFNANGSTQAGSWVEINNTPNLALASENGSTGYDEYGYPTQRTLWLAAEAVGAFQFSRPEDVATNPANGKEFVLASTGGVSALGDPNGTVYTMQLDFTSITAPTGTLKVIYDGNDDPAQALRTPDNLEWSADGFIYVQEDRSNGALFNPAAANPNEASIVKLDPVTGAITRVAEIDRGAVPFGQVDSAPTDFGNWESSGIVDVSALFGEAPGSLFLADTQAHSISLGSTALVEGGQLVLVAAPGVEVSPNIETDTLASIENVVGTNAADQIIGSAVANSLYGEAGDDGLSGGAGDDRLFGGQGSDYIAGDAGNDAVFGGLGNDYILGGAGDDSVAGEEGDDSVFGGDGNDYVLGGSGNDSLDGQGGNDVIFGGSGDDYVFGGAGDDQVDGADGVDSVFGFDGMDIVRGGTGNDQIDGGAGNDTLFGDAGDDWLFGQADDDTIDGGIGSDVLFGGDGNDTLGGGVGIDTLIGGAGNDSLRGGTEADYFTFADGFGNDRIEDFENGLDFINMSEVTGLNAFSELVLTQVGADTQIVFAGNTITIANTVVADITAADVIV